MNGAIKGAIVNNNSFNGIAAVASGSAYVSVVDSEASGNGNVGLFASGPTVVLALRSVTVSNNVKGVVTFAVGGTVQVLLAHSLIVRNNVGTDNTSGGTISSYGDNDINFNATSDVNGSLTPLAQR